MFLTIIIAILGFSLLILIHELGHFLAAKWMGMTVEEFGIGFPPRIWAKKSKKTGVEYSINWIPFGGFVRIKGEDAVYKEGQPPEEGSFKSKSIPRRMFVIVAGVLMNLLLAVIIFSIISMIGIPSAVEDSQVNVKNPQVQILEVMPDSPAESAGLKNGDIIKYIDAGFGKISIITVDKIVSLSNENRGNEISLFVLRDGSEKNIKIIPRKVFPENQGAMGISLIRIGFITVPWYKAPIEGVKMAWTATETIFMFLGGMIRDLFTKGTVPADVVGPVGIIAMSGQIAQMGFNYVMWIFGIISINLFLINLLPIPALDGGRLLFLAIEGVKGSPVSPKLEQTLHYFGFLLLIALMILITIRDVVRLF